MTREPWLQSQFRCWLKHRHSVRTPYRWADGTDISETRFNALWDEVFEDFMGEMTKVEPSVDGGVVDGK